MSHSNQAIEQFHQAVQHHQQGRLADALALYAKVETAFSNNFDFLHFYGIGLLQSGRHAEAVEKLQRAVNLRSQDITALSNFGTALLELGQAEAAIRQFSTALAIDSHRLDVLVNRGNALFALPRFDDALRDYEQVLKLDRNNLHALLGRGNSLLKLERFAESLICFDRALLIDSKNINGLINRGAALFKLNRLDDARKSLEAALHLNPESASALFNLANTVWDLSQNEKALALYAQVTALDPGYVEVWAALGNRLLQIGIIAPARRITGYGFTLKPDDFEIGRKVLLNQYYDPNITCPEMFNELRDVIRQSDRAAPVDVIKRGSKNFSNVLEAKRKLKIAYLSSDFVNHPSAHNLLPILEHRSRDGFELHLFSLNRKVDGISERLRSLVDYWHAVPALSDLEIANQIRAHKIDILVLMAGKFDANRPFVARYRAAPIQISLHDTGSSGIEEMDYVLASTVMVPANSSERFVERVIRLPHFVVHNPPKQSPDVNPLPMLKRGFVTFGSFNSPQKINDRVLKTWSDLLHALPDARLKLKYMNKFQSEFLCNRILAKLDVAPDRVSFYRGPQTSMTEHFSHYHDIDVALDTFPFPGATTTFEALWMGVPVLALPGDTMMSRWSLEDLMAVGLNQFVANSPEDFVQRGVEWAANPTGLTAIRSTVRERLRNSPLCDGAARARQFERVFQAVWRRWLANRQPGQ